MYVLMLVYCTKSKSGYDLKWVNKEWEQVAPDRPAKIAKHN